MDHPPSPYALKEPYPSIANVVANSCDLSIAYGLYSGTVSEYTAIAQYVYHHMYAHQEGLETLAQTWIDIAIVEMRHLDMLGDLILKLGGAPRFITPTHNGYLPWNSTAVDYGCTLKEMALLDVKSEQSAICSYLQGAKRACQAEMSALLRRISQDEELHLQAFTQMLHTV